MSHVTPVLLIVLSFLAARIDNGAAGAVQFKLLHCRSCMIIIIFAASSANNASRCSVSCELGSNVQFHGFGKTEYAMSYHHKTGFPQIHYFH